MNRIAGAATVVLLGLVATAHAQPALTAPAPGAPVETSESRICNTIYVELVPLALITLAVGVERRVADRVSVAGFAGFGRTGSVVVGDRVHEYARGSGTMLEDARFTRMHVGAQANYYQRSDFRGIHFGGDLMYRFYGFATQDFPSASVLTVAGYAGWKWIAPSGFTIVMQGGLSLPFTAGGLDGSDGLALNTDGTFKAVHVWGNLGAGWTY